LVNYPKKNEREAGGVDGGERWTREEDGGRARQPLIYSGFLLSGEGGEKAGKQVIRSRGLSIEVGVGGT